jgi:hypothetical protein
MNSLFLSASNDQSTRQNHTYNRLRLVCPALFPLKLSVLIPIFTYGVEDMTIEACLFQCRRGIRGCIGHHSRFRSHESVLVQCLQCDPLSLFENFISFHRIALKFWMALTIAFKSQRNCRLRRGPQSTSEKSNSWRFYHCNLITAILNRGFQTLTLLRRMMIRCFNFQG